MIPINNSDLAWLVVSDYNQDNGIGYPDALREDVYDPDVDSYMFEYNSYGVSVGTICHGGLVVGGFEHPYGEDGLGLLPYAIGRSVASLSDQFVGGSSRLAGILVGGNLGSDYPSSIPVPHLPRVIPTVPS